MIYTWRCKETGEIREVERSLKDYDVPPPSEGHQWERVILTPPSVPFNELSKTVFDYDAPRTI